jgi:hypothetical protein
VVHCRWPSRRSCSMRTPATRSVRRTSASIPRRCSARHREFAGVARDPRLQLSAGAGTSSRAWGPSEPSPSIRPHLHVPTLGQLGAERDLRCSPPTCLALYSGANKKRELALWRSRVLTT